MDKSVLPSFMDGLNKLAACLDTTKKSTKKRQFCLGTLHCSPFTCLWIAVNDTFFFLLIWSLIYKIIIYCSIFAQKSGLWGWFRKRANEKKGLVYIPVEGKWLCCSDSLRKDPTWEGTTAVLPFLEKFSEFLLRK